jgi:hypothetical protein
VRGDQVTTQPTVPAPRTRSRRLVILGLVIALIAAGVLVVRPIFPALLYPSRQLVGWSLGDGVGGPRFDPAYAQATTVVSVSAWWPGAAPDPPDTSWVEPIITYTPWSVMITLHSRIRGPCDTSALPCVGKYLMPFSIPVQLSEPLGARALFDGSTFPPAARPYQ